MPSVTISLDPDILSKIEHRAAQSSLSVEVWIRDRLAKELGLEDPAWIEAFFQKADRLGLRSSDGRPLSRAECNDH